jgi:hypothetical protein
MTGTSGSYTMTENGNLSSTLVDNGNNVTGGDSQTLTVPSDSYTIVETGTLSGSAFSETLTGTDSVTQTQTGNTLAGNFIQTITGTGSYSRTEIGGTLGSSSGSMGYTATETASPLAGRYNETLTGTDRYVLLQEFSDVSDSGSSSAPGHMNFSPYGTAFVDASPTSNGFHDPDATKKLADEIGRLTEKFIEQGLDKEKALQLAQKTCLKEYASPEEAKEILKALNAAEDAAKSTPKKDPVVQRWGRIGGGSIILLGGIIILTKMDKGLDEPAPGARLKEDTLELNGRSQVWIMPDGTIRRRFIRRDGSVDER